MLRLQSALLLSTALGVSGCMNLAPVYDRPNLAVPASLPAAPTGIPFDTLLAWDQVIVSPELRELIELALADNRSLQSLAATSCLR